jgi:transcriptional regulator with XRE-family HTH domain/Zn-dependent peptidase ImmA (M78 family)
MAVGERLKMARHMAGMSMRALAEQTGVSAMAISKYERDKMTPSSEVLIQLAQALDVRVGFFLRPVTADLTAPAFRRRSRLKVKAQKAILAKTQAWLERYLDVESFFADRPVFTLPAIDRQVTTLEDVERVALGLREAWDLGLDPIDNLIEVLESHGIKVDIIEGADDFDALTLWANETDPVMVVKAGMSGDRQRLSLAHELGHLILEPVDELDEEKAAFRLAGAFLIPRPVALYELGEHRRSLGLHELHLLKHKYGVSMQAWIYRARDLDIISEHTAQQLWIRFRSEGWYEEEPGDQIPPEAPGRMKRLVLRALAEDVISESRAAELLGEPLAQFWQEEAEQHAGFPTPVRC